MTDIDPTLLRLLCPALVALVVFLLRRYGWVFRKVPPDFLPLVAVAVGALLGLLATVVGLAPEQLSAMETALEGALGGLAGGGTWGWRRIAARIVDVFKARLGAPPPE